MVTRYELYQLLAPRITDELIVTSIGGVDQELHSLLDRPGNLYHVTMSVAPSVALGLALALLWMRPRRNGLIVLASLIGFGIVVKLIAQAVIPGLLSPPTIKVASEAVSAAFERLSQQFGIYVQQWILLPKDPALPGNLAFVILIPALLTLSRMKTGAIKLAATVPVLYLLAFVWETRLTAEPAVTRLLLIGSLLVIMMIFRPHGLLGRRRVEIV